MSSLPPPRELEELDDGWGADERQAATGAVPPPPPATTAVEPDLPRATRVAELERDLEERTGELAELREQLTTTRSELTAAEERIRSLEALQAAQAAELGAAHEAQRSLLDQLHTSRNLAEATAGDDLELIKGIGPKLSQKLKAAGISRFADLAELDTDGVDRLAERLGIHRSRIERNGWVETARQLAEKARS